MSNAHKIQIREYVIPGREDIRIEFNCPSGCVRGAYMWGDPATMRHFAEVISAAHTRPPDPGLLDISHGEMSTSNVPRRPSANEMVWNEMSPKPPGERDAPPPTG